jgi:hypothetical protein
MKIINTSDSTRLIKLPFDEQTQNFYIGKRFMGELFNNIPQCWKIKDLNSDEEKGILIVSLEKDEYNPSTDSIQYGICDYITPVENPPEPITDYAEIKSGGSSKTFNVDFYDVTGTPIEGVVAVWDLVIPEGYNNYIVSVIDGNSISIKALDNDDLISQTLTLNVSDGNTIINSIDIKVVALI